MKYTLIMMAKRVLFLCTGNSCRSQIAEAVVNEFDEQWIAYSAGTKPTGFVHPVALTVLDEIGIQHQGESKNIDQVMGIAFDLVITVCDSAAKECPVWLGMGERLHIGFQDPAQATGSDEEIIDAFRSTRDEIFTKIPEILENYDEKIAQ